MSISFETLALAKKYTDEHGGGGGEAGKDLGVSGAVVGQLIIVKTVDADGKPTSWEPIDQIDVDGIIDVSDSQPSSSDNKMWLLDTTPEGIQIPTYAEFSALEGSIASQYDSTASYAVGAFCSKDDVLYKCNTPIPSGGEVWNAAHWTAVRLADPGTLPQLSTVVSGKNLTIGFN